MTNNMDIFKIDFKKIHLFDEFKTEGWRHIFIHLCTAIGAWGGYPTPPVWWEDLVNSHELVKWFLLAVLIFQGGDEQELQMALEFTALFYLAYHFSNKLYSKSDNWIDNKFHNYIQTLKDMDIDGIEVYYPGYSHNTVNTLLEVCENQKLLVSGGSDFHGSRKPNNLLGIGYENSPIKVPYELLSKMKELHAKL